MTEYMSSPLPAEDVPPADLDPEDIEGETDDDVGADDDVGEIEEDDPLGLMEGTP